MIVLAEMEEIKHAQEAEDHSCSLLLNWIHKMKH